MRSAGVRAAGVQAAGVIAASMRAAGWQTAGVPVDGMRAAVGMQATYVTSCWYASRLCNSCWYSSRLCDWLELLDIQNYLIVKVLNLKQINISGY